MWYWYDISGWRLILGGILMIIFWGGIIALMVRKIRRAAAHDGSGATAGRSPLDIARELYSRGEVSQEGFEQIKRDLSSIPS